MPASAIPAIIAAAGGLATGGMGMLAANKKRKRDIEDQTRFLADPVLEEQKTFGDQMMSQPNVSLRSGGKPIIFPKTY